MVFLGKLVINQLVSKCPAFVELEGSLPYPEEPAI
jgi:hypothetical protein